jgi:hypothetical protein
MRKVLVEVTVGDGDTFYTSNALIARTVQNALINFGVTWLIVEDCESACSLVHTSYICSLSQWLWRSSAALSGAASR